VKRIWLTHSRRTEEGGWLDLEELRTPGVLRMLDIIAICSAVLLLFSGLWLYGGATSFLGSMERMGDSAGDDSLSGPTMIDGRWAWEAKLLFDDCTPLNGTWVMPPNLAEQDGVFWYPGELECVWEYQGTGDRAVIAIRNAAEQDLELRVLLSTDEISFGSTGDTVTVPANESEVVSLEIDSDGFEESVYARIESVVDPNASITLKLLMISDSTQRSSHTYEGQSINVHYKVWIHDTGELLDEGDLPVTAGEDPNYIKGFGWGVLGLDYDFIDRGTLGSGTTHTVLLPPDLAYKNRDDRPEANNQWLRFELRLNYAIV